jgi:transposase-like protein
VGLDELCRLAAQEMLKVALLVERQAYLDAHADQLDGTGKRLVVGNGYAKERQVTTGTGMVEVKAPRVDDRRDGQHYRSVILPAYMRKSPKVTEVLPVLYLRGLSTGDFAPALGEFFGSRAGLSASTVARLTEAWQDERERWAGRDLSGTDYVYWWVDGVHFNVRLEEDRLCCLVIVGVRPDGTKELVALADGYRESKESWAALLRSLRQRGLSGPVLAVGDGALGFWAALRDVFPSTKEQRCWVHKSANVIDALPKRLQPQAKSAVQAIYNAGSRTEALSAAKSFVDAFSGFPKATKKVMDELDTLLAFYDFPKEHWAHLRTVTL